MQIPQDDKFSLPINFFAEAIGALSKTDYKILDGRFSDIDFALRMAFHTASGGSPERAKAFFETAPSTSVPEDLAKAMARIFKREFGAAKMAQASGWWGAFLNAVAHHATRPVKVAAPGEGLEAWLASDGIGTSSMFIARTLFPARTTSEHLRPAIQYTYGEGKLRGVPVPCDAGDFKRCLDLVDAEPEARHRLGELSVFPEWKPIVGAWEVLEATARTGDAKAVYGILRDLAKSRNTAAAEENSIRC